MSRLSKEVTIDGKKIEVFELTVKEIKKLWKDLEHSSPETEQTPIFQNEQLMRDHWDNCIHGIKLEETENLAPSELKLIYDDFVEVNAIFFDLALKLEGGNPLLASLRELVVTELMLRYASLFQGATEKETSGVTDTPSS